MRPLALDLDEALGLRPVPEQHIAQEGDRPGERVFVVTCGELERRITEQDMAAWGETHADLRTAGPGPILSAIDELRAAYRHPYAYMASLIGNPDTR